MRVLFIYSDPTCSCTKRVCFDYSKALQRKKQVGNTLHFSKLNVTLIAKYDVFIFQRIGANGVIIRKDHLKVFDIFIRHCNKNKKPTFYHIDDLVIHDQNNIPVWFMERVDGVIVPNHSLERIVRRYNANVGVVRTHLDFNIRPIAVPPKDNYRVLIASTGGMGEPFLCDLIPYVHQLCPEIKFEVIGGYHDLRRKLNSHYVSYYHIVELDELLSFFHRANIFLNVSGFPEKVSIRIKKILAGRYTVQEFVNCKSENKYVLAGYTNTVLMASASMSYEHAIKNGVNGYVLEDNLNIWAEYIVGIVRGRINTIDVLKNAHDDVIKNYSVDSRIDELITILRSEMTKKKKRNTRHRPLPVPYKSQIIKPDNSYKLNMNKLSKVNLDKKVIRQKLYIEKNILKEILLYFEVKNTNHTIVLKLLDSKLKCVKETRMKLDVIGTNWMPFDLGLISIEKSTFYFLDITFLLSSNSTTPNRSGSLT